jgi:hypothetical protein
MSNSSNRHQNPDFDFDDTGQILQGALCTIAALLMSHADTISGRLALWPCVGAIAMRARARDDGISPTCAVAPRAGFWMI